MFKHFLIMTLFLFLLPACHDENKILSEFPLKNYSQNISDWIKPSDAPLITEELQKERLAFFYTHYIGNRSPWNKEYIIKILNLPAPENLLSTEKNIIESFDNVNKEKKELLYGENYKPYSTSWIAKIKSKMNFETIGLTSYQPNNRAIATDNLHARVLPTDDVAFYSYQRPGQGYPFDNLQMSAVWAGTPLYVISKTRDQEWSLVLTPEFIAWVKTSGIAKADSKFIQHWKKSAKKSLFAITQTETPIITSGQFRFSAYIGSVFPGTKDQLLIPVKNIQGNAVIQLSNVKNAVAMPLKATANNFKRIIKTMAGRPYGWGNMYFYNDCSAELKSILTPFGFWLPRHSSDQVYMGKITDLKTQSATQRIDYLKQKGRPFFTIVYIGGHVFMYIGTFANIHTHNKEMVMTYQNIWGLSPKPPSRRAVIGQAAFLPLLSEYPEDTSLNSLANKTDFQVSDLASTSSNLTQLQLIDLKILMNP